MANDHDLRTIVALLDRYCANLAAVPTSLRNTVSEWVAEEPFWVPGVIDLKLEDLVRDSAQAESLVGLLGHMEGEIAVRGDYVRLEDVQAVLNVDPALQLGDYPTSGLLKAIRELRKLMTPS